ncbi:hypothetical protein GCM10022406_16100 [Hymenobacter algoricola]|uniref:T9SS type A sorting domain-containing protein n=2 Tax=Hymenobacter algoricola TaxID=486267 RepID=A0ABP7MWW7_9BACT
MHAMATLLSMLVVVSATNAAQAQSFDRAVVCASGIGAYGWGPAQVTIDGQGNTYVTGRFNGTITLGGFVLSATQKAPSYSFPSDNFVAKLDADGNYLWAVQMADNQAAVITKPVVDAAGDVYVAGSFSSYSIRFGTSGPVLFNSSARSEGFIAKLQGSTGQWLWARRAGGVGDDYLDLPVVNSAGNLCLLGFNGGTAADAGPFSVSGRQHFLAQLNPAGVWQWVRPLGNPEARIANLLLDAQDNLYLAGTFRSPSITFGATTLTTQSVPGTPSYSYELFVAKANAAGTWQWAVQGDAVTHQNLVEGATLSADGLGHLYVAGSYTNRSMRIGATVLLNLSTQYPLPNPLPPVPYTNNYYPDAFVACLDTAGQWQWATRNGGTYFEQVSKVMTDTQGRVYVLGFLDEMRPAISLAQKVGQLDAATGRWRTVQSLAPSRVQDMALDRQDRLTLAGYFDEPTAQFGSFTLPSAGTGSTGFLARQGPGPLATRSPASSAAWQVWPNPSGQGEAWVLGPQPGKAVHLVDVLGRVVLRTHMPPAGALRLNTATLPKGLYVLRSQNQTARLVIN